MIAYRRNTLERDASWLIIWLIFIAMTVLLVSDFAEGQQLIDRRRDDAVCITYYSANGATGTRYGDCH